MKKPLPQLLALGLFFLGIAAVTAHGQGTQDPIMWGADKEGGGPYLFLGPEGGLIGYELEIIQALEKQLNRKIEFRQYDFASLIPGLSKGDIAIAMNGLEITPERRSQVLFTRPYYIYRQQLVARKDEKRFDSYKASLKVPGLKYGTMESTAAERLLRQDGIDPATYPAPTEAYRELALGRIDAVVLDLPMATFYAKKDPKLTFLSEPFAPGEYAIALAKNHETLRGDLNLAIGNLIASGQLKAILEKWDLWDDAQAGLANEDGMGGLTVQDQSWTLSSYLPMLLKGTAVTIALTLCSFALAVGLGLPLALIRVYGPAPLKFLAICHIEFFRGIPVYILLLLVYFGLPELWSVLNLPPFVAAVIGLGLNYSAYEAEIYRSALQSVPAGQWEAALSLGMDRVKAFRRIILPQAFKVALPPMTGDLVALFKDTSIASAISLVELNKQYQILAKSSNKFMEIGLMTALIYLVLSVPLGWLSRRLEETWGHGDEN